MKQLHLILLMILILLNPSIAQEISQWRGKNRDGIYSETKLLKQWPEKGPEMLWSQDNLGKGHSSVAVYDNMIYITGMKDTTDYLTAMDMEGNVKWCVPFGRSWLKTFPDTRSTPTIKDNKIYVVSGTGELYCFDAKTGITIWRKNAFEQYNGAWGEWGICESPLLVDDKVIFTPAGTETTIIALNKNNGELIWKTESLQDTGAYVSPILVEHNGKKMIIQLIAKHLFGVDAESGKILWKYNYSTLKADGPLAIWPGGPLCNTNTPLYKDGEVYITKGYNHVGAKFKISEDAKDIELLWTDSVLDIHHGGMVLVDGYIYGANWINNRDGNWCCIDWKTGKKLYETEWKTKGSVIFADGMLYCYEEKRGNLALVKANNKEFKVISSFRIPKGNGPSWSHPVIRNGVLYLRHGKELMAFNIKE